MTRAGVVCRFGVGILFLLCPVVSFAQDAVWQRFAGFEQEETVVRGQNGYAGAQVCESCHRDEHRGWQATPHADAYETLVTEQADRRPECLTCHTTGFQYVSGFEIGDEGRRLAGVQCETCHGPGLQHVRRPEVRNIRGEVGPQVCKDCHNAEQTPDFDAQFADLMERVNHRAEEVPGAGAGAVEAALVLGGEHPVRVELFVMAQCPYGIQAEQALLPAIRALGTEVDFRLYFIAEEAGTDSGKTLASRALSATRDACAGEPVEGTGQFRSLHGDPEVEEGIRQVVMMAYYPDRFFEYLTLRNKDIYFSNWKRCASQAGMDPARIEAAASGTEGEALFRENIRRANQLGINASPTLLVNGREIDAVFDADALKRQVCRSGGGGSLCASYPECEQDRDCVQPRKVGVCVKPGTSEARCRFTDPVPFQVTVLNDPLCALCETGHFIRSTLELFPGAQVQTLDIAAPGARELITRYQIDRVPAFVMDERFAKTAHFQRFARTVRQMEDGYLPEPAMVPMARLLGRPEESGRLDLFLDPAFPFALGLAGQLITWVQAVDDVDRLRVHFFSVEEGGAEPLPYLCAQKLAPEQLQDYLMCRIRAELGGEGRLTPERCVSKLGLSQERFSQCVDGEEGRGLLDQAQAVAAAFGIRGRMNPVVVMDNRDVVSGRLVQHIQDLFYEIHPDLLSRDGKKMETR